MDMNVSAVATRRASPDLVIPATLMAAIALVLPPLHAQPWWLILPCLICLILRWQLFAFIMLFTSMSYADGWSTGAYYLVLSLLVLMRLHSNQAASSLTQLGGSLRQIFLAIPMLMIILLLMLAAGARWSERSSPERAATGISETMSPGAVSELINDGSLAMRVSFLDGGSAERLQRIDLYWRGLVLEEFDGRTWSRSDRLEFDLDPVPGGVPMDDQLRYLVTLEPARQFWLYGLHQAYTMREQSYRDTRGMLVTSDLIRQRIRYPVTSIPPSRELSLDPETRQRNLTLPAGSNPRTRLWVQSVRSQYADDQSFTDAVLRQFTEQDFYYTMTPGLNGEHNVDDFLFTSRQGYCEHYASALAFMLRAAGIPARIVNGYQGGNFNPITGHWSVYQYNAHAWVEAWFPDSGWQRLDPTTYVAPERIQLGMDAWLAGLSNDSRSDLDRDARLRLQLATLPGYQSARNALDALQFGWNLSMYDSAGNLRTEDLSDWLENQGLGNLPVWLLALLLAAVGARAMWIERGKRQTLSAAVREYLRLDAKLRKSGLGREPGETIAAHLRRVGKKRPDKQDEWRQLALALTEREYGDAGTATRR